MDFLVDSNCVVEATIQKRLETKITSTFLRFVDITKKHPNFKCALIVDEVHVLFHKTLGKKYFPTSEYRVFLASGFALLALDDITKLRDFLSGERTALQSSSPPAGFNARSISGDRHRLGREIIELLKSGPKTRGNIAKATGKSKWVIPDAVKLFPEIKKVSSYYGLSEESIYRVLLAKGSRSKVQHSLVQSWLRTTYLRRLQEHGACRTKDFALSLGVSLNSLTHFIHGLERDRIIKRVSKGKWDLADRAVQQKLG